MKTKILLKSLMVLIVSLFFTFGANAQAWDVNNLIWETDTPFQPMNIIVTNATLDDVVLDEDDQIGVFFANDLLVGYANVPANFPTTPLTITISLQDGPVVNGNPNGAIPGDSLYFKYYPLGGNILPNVDANYSSGDHIAIAWGTSVASLSLMTLQTQTIDLAVGLNLVTFNVEPEDISVYSIFAPLTAQGKLVKAESHGGLYQYIQSNNWVSNLGEYDATEEEWNILFTQGYWVEVNSATTLNLVGTAVTTTDIVLEKGWNILPYYGTDDNGVLATEIMLTAVLAGVDLEQVIIINEDGDKLYRDANDWVGATTMKFYPNKAYTIYVNADAIFTYL